MGNSSLVNPQLEGDAFFWEAGETGILLIHGLTATAAEVRLFAKILLANGYTVAGPLLAGHGTSPDDLNRTTWKDWVASAEEVYQKLRRRCKTVLIGGESAGAVISLSLACQHPEIPLLLLYAPAIQLNLTRFQRLQIRVLAPFGLKIPKGNLDASHAWQGYPVNPLKAAIQLQELGDEVLRGLPAIRQPVLVVQGRHDTTIAPRSGEIILNGISSPVKELHWFENSSHVVLIDQELEQIAALSLQFIKTNLPQPAAR
jgi:carboxylesterase